MLDHFITGLLYWIAIGSFLWAIFDPARFDDYALRWYVVRRKRLPSTAWLLAAHVAAILAGPVVVVVALVKLHRRVWH